MKNKPLRPPTFEDIAATLSPEEFESLMRSLLTKSESSADSAPSSRPDFCEDRAIADSKCRPA